MDLEKLQATLDTLHQPAYRFKQIKLAVYRDLKDGFGPIDNIPLALRQDLDRLLPFSELVLRTEQKSRDGSVKALFATLDGVPIESVLIPYGDGTRTVCVSTEAGCQANCAFCATGHLGFTRVLWPSEIVEQVLYFARVLKPKGERVTNVVFMGEGEPFLNYDNVKNAILLLNDKDGFNLGQRRISVSTSGIIPGIERFTGEDWQVNLAISLHAPVNGLRSILMPINRTYPLEQLMPALDAYVAKSNRKLMIEYLVLGGLNDSVHNADALADLIHKYKEVLRLSVVNLIVYNPVKDSSGRPDRFKAPRPASLRAFEEVLTKREIDWTRRASFGSDISGACGQLAGEARPNTEEPGDSSST
ncbi:MAG: 23S rRNA (adenine(2503)-C(2))-methyltransferase RlmN [Caldiserica bacterium]|nr:23S rRNA (adenine(2503)-C(2))-methyltransferase RlmN [Caldisericota bacterium]